MAGYQTQLSGKTVLVTGGTGFIGRALCRALAGYDANLYVLSRQKHIADMPIRCQLIQSLDEIPQEHQVDVVINLSGETIAQRWTECAKKRIVDSRVGLTEKLVAWMLKRKDKPRVFISGSAIGIYGTDPQKEFTEKEPLGASESFSQDLCARWEAAASVAETAGIRTILMRTGVVLGKGGGTLQKLWLLFSLGLGGRIANGKQWFSWIHLEDIVQMMIWAACNETIRGTLNGTAPSPVSNADFTRAFGRALGRPALFPVPAFVLRTGFGQMADELMIQGQKVIPEKAQNSGFVFKYPEIDKALADIVAA